MVRTGRDAWQLELLTHLDRVPQAGALLMASWPKPQGGPFAAELPLTFQVAEKTTTRTVTKGKKKGR